MDSIIIAIDGHSSCGKSTLARALAKKLGYTYIDTGAMYRSVTLYFIQNNINFNDAEQVADALSKISISFRNEGQRNITYLNDINVEEEIRKMYVSDQVSPVATISAVRRDMVRQQQTMGIHKSIVMDGRDIGTVVFPEAELKIFLTAETDIRAQRRYEELTNKGQSVDFETIKTNLLNRDRIDSTRKDSPLKKATDAIVIDNTQLSQDQQLQIAYDLAINTMKAKASTGA